MNFLLFSGSPPASAKCRFFHPFPIKDRHPRVHSFSSSWRLMSLRVLPFTPLPARLLISHREIRGCPQGRPDELCSRSTFFFCGPASAVSHQVFFFDILPYSSVLRDSSRCSPRPDFLEGTPCLQRVDFDEGSSPAAGGIPEPFRLTPISSPCSEFIPSSWSLFSCRNRVADLVTPFFDGGEETPPLARFEKAFLPGASPGFYLISRRLSILRIGVSILLLRPFGIDAKPLHPPPPPEDPLKNLTLPPVTFATDAFGRICLRAEFTLFFLAPGQKLPSK